MAKLALPPVTSLANTQSALGRINDNYDLIEDAVENTLSRDGTAPNQMEADFDMNSNDILNAGTIYTGTLVIDGELVVPGSSFGMTVKTFGAVGDGVTDDTAAIAAAVAYAFSTGEQLGWPAGTYLTTDTIPNFLDVRHIGVGTVVRGPNEFHISPLEAEENDLFVSPSGSDLNDGLSATEPLATITKALSVFVERGNSGRWTINLAAGTYTENPILSSLTPQEFPLDIRGPDVGGTPNVPTAIISAASASVDVLRISDQAWMRVYDVLLQDATSGAAFNANGSCRATLTNVHIANCLNATVVQHSGLLAFTGGVWDGNGLGGIGFNSLYNATHSHQPASLAGATLIQNYATGAQIQEGGQGHLDFLKIHDCTTAGMTLRRGAGGCNTRQMQIYRNAVGVLVDCNGWFNNAIDFGTGADANTVNVRATGGAPEFDFRSSDYSSRTKRLQQTTLAVSHTGTTASTQVWEFADIRPWMLSEGGEVAEIVAVLNNAASAGTIGISLFLWDGTTEDFLSGVSLPIGTTNAQVRALVNFSAVGSQRASVAAIHNAGALCGAYGTGALNLKNLTGALRIKVTLSSAADTAFFQFIELHTSFGG